MEIVFDILVISGGVLGCFMSMSIACSSFFKSKANNYLSISILILSIIMVLGWLNPGTGIFEMLRAIMWEMLIPVTLLTYFLIHLKHPFFKTKVYKLLYLPFIVSFLIDVFFELDFSMNLYKLPVDTEDSIVQIIFSIENWLSIFLNAILMIWARSLIKKSNIEQKIRHWLLRLNAMLLGIIFIWFLQELGIILLGSTFSLLVIWISISILLWFVLYYGVFKLQIAIERKEIHQLIIRQKKENSTPIQHQKIFSKDSKIGQSNQQLKFVAQFIKLMEKDEWYKNPLLSRLNLATELGISEGYFSQKINQEFGKSVTQIINEYRITEAKQLLQDPTFNKYSIEAIGMEAGFKSKSVFYHLFKSSTGMSPGIFREQNEVS